MNGGDGKAMWLFTLALGGALSVAVTDQFVLGRFGEMAVAAATMVVVYYVVLFAYRQVAEFSSDETA